MTWCYLTSRHLKSSLTSETSHWTSCSLDSVWIQSSSRPWFPNEMQNLLLSEKRILYHWATVQLFFSLAQVRCFWRCFCFRSGLVALFQKISKHGDSGCTDSSFSPLLVKCLNQLCLTVFSSGHPCCLCTFSYPISYALIKHSVNSHPFLYGGCQWLSSGPFSSQQSYPLLWFQRTIDTMNLYCRDGHLNKLKM